MTDEKRKELCDMILDYYFKIGQKQGSWLTLLVIGYKDHRCQRFLWQDRGSTVNSVYCTYHALGENRIQELVCNRIGFERTDKIWNGEMKEIQYRMTDEMKGMVAAS